MQLWKLTTSLDELLLLEGKAREAILELDITTLNLDDGIKKLNEKLDTLF